MDVTSYGRGLGARVWMVVATKAMNAKNAEETGMTAV